MTTVETAGTRLSRRRRLLLVGAAAGWAAGCAGPALPPVVWLRLPLDADPPLPSGRAVGGGPQGGWQLVGALGLPGHLDRDAVLVPQGRGALLPLAGLRWAEPLREVLPRLLRSDLGVLLGTPVWAAPLPPGVAPTRQLRVTLQALDLSEAARTLAIRAQWSLGDPGMAAVPRQAAWTLALASADADGIALAHRRALAELAQRIAASAASPSP
jgi:uncharacterized protein